MPARSRDARRAIGLAATALLALRAPPAAAAGPSGALPAACAPIACAADYVGMPADVLEGAYIEGEHSGIPLAGANLVILLLDSAERLKLSALGAADTPAELVEAHQILATHDEDRDAVVNQITASLTIHLP
jgi:hypothetical protein